ncbi:AraC family transcriptional regulator [Sphingomonas sp. GlSt437]|uniref:helix-turn-helix transcriptional regulator n=1 Tax=Sphingomonas sp. GlSt437 TaxID=3389970 RepID=UPI003A856E83
MDQFDALFGQFTPTARAFFTGNLCQAIGFENPDGLGYLHILKSGRMTVSGAGHDAIEIAEPSILLLPRNTAHGFDTDRETGADLICATIQIGGGAGNPIALGLPDLVVIRLAEIANLAPTLDLLLDEAFAARDGRQVALDRLFEYLFVQLLRHVIASGVVTGGMLAGLADARLARAITAMHERPERLWTLDDLAEEAGMSRTRFAAHFRETTGTTPVDYLTRWRMTVAQNLMRKGKPIKAVARAVGYESPAALSRAFSKMVGVSPRSWASALRG